MLSPGVHENLSFDEYREIKAVNATALKEGREKTMLHMWQAVFGEERKKETPAMAIGTAAHSATLEPDSFAERYFIAPMDRPKKTDNEGKAMHKAMEEKAAKRQLLWANEARDLMDMRRSVYAHPRAAQILSGSRRELTILWEEAVPVDGVEVTVPCKARLDVLNDINGLTIIADLKTTEDASPDEFRRSVINYGYAHQGAWYVRGARFAGLKPDAYCVIPLEKSRPFAVAVYQLPQGDWLRPANKRNERTLQRFARCLHRNEWPAYSADIIELPVPAWAAEKL